MDSEITLESLLAMEATPNTTETNEKKWVFVRLYDMNYQGAATGVNVLKGSIKLTTGKAADEKTLYNHAAMNTSLNDTFVGLSLKPGKNHLDRECIAKDSKSYPYMRKMANASTSKYIVLAVPVTGEEYKDVKKIIRYSLENKSLLKWDIPKLLGTLGFRAAHADIQSVAKKEFSQSMWNKLHTQHENVNVKEVFAKEKNNRFVCSTFVAFVLSKASKRMQAFFKKYEFNADSFAPNDLTYIPFAKVVAKGTWNNYDQDIARAVAKNPEWSEYWKGSRTKD